MKRIWSMAVLLQTMLLAFGQLGSSTIEAQTFSEIVAKEELNLDTSVSVDEGEYTQPKAILVTPIFLEDDVSVDAREWYRGLFYYFSSERHHYTDLPAHYVLDQEGQLYEGMDGGPERRLVVGEAASSPILILYLAERGQTDFSLSAKSTLQSFLLKLANENEINPERIEVSALALKIDEEKKEATLTKEEIFGSWLLSATKLKESVARSYKPTPKVYAVSVSDIKLPEGKVQIGSQVVLRFKVKNTGNYTIFSDSDSELILSKKNGDASQLFVNGLWVSQTQAPILSSGTVLLPGEEENFEVKLNVPFAPGAYGEEFSIKTAGGQALRGTDINIKLNIDRGTLKILEITATETGTLNVRSNPSSGGEVVGRVSPGERFVWTETQNGWYKIKFESREGWVLGRYVRVL